MFEIAPRGPFLPYSNALGPISVQVVSPLSVASSNLRGRLQRPLSLTFGSAKYDERTEEKDLYKETIGTLELTETHLCFYLKGKEGPHVKIPVSMFNSLERHTVKGLHRAVIYFDDNTTRSWVMNSSEEVMTLATGLYMVSQGDDLKTSAALRIFYDHLYKDVAKRRSLRRSAWAPFTWEQELARLGLPDRNWVLVDNSEFRYCGTYPKPLVQPGSLNPDLIMQAADFRRGKRFPTMVYHHPENEAALMVAGQPLIGPFDRRSPPNEQMMRAIAAMSPSGTTHIMDVRKSKDVETDRKAFGGADMVDHYNDGAGNQASVQSHLLHLDDLQTIANAFYRLKQSCKSLTSLSADYSAKGEGIEWQRVVHGTLRAAQYVAQVLEYEASSVMLVSAQGTDRNLLVASLAEFLVDPFYRTIRGFQFLIDKTWISMGHPFATRYARYSSYYDDNSSPSSERAPIFHLFLDCIYQIITQKPNAVEFTPNLLILLQDELYMGWGGNFLGNSEQERSQDLQDEERTSHGGIWEKVHTDSRHHQYVNPLYEYERGILPISLCHCQVHLWVDYFARQDLDWDSKRMLSAKLRDNDSQLRSNERHLASVKTWVAQMRRSVHGNAAVAESVQHQQARSLHPSISATVQVRRIDMNEDDITRNINSRSPATAVTDSSQTTSTVSSTERKVSNSAPALSPIPPVPDPQQEEPTLKPTSAVVSPPGARTGATPSPAASAVSGVKKSPVPMLTGLQQRQARSGGLLENDSDSDDDHDLFRPPQQRKVSPAISAAKPLSTSSPTLSSPPATVPQSNGTGDDSGNSAARAQKPSKPSETTSADCPKCHMPLCVCD
eukprot:Clim_evm250s157 gene=Clim_evmTU250s157